MQIRHHAPDPILGVGVAVRWHGRLSSRIWLAWFRHGASPLCGVLPKDLSGGGGLKVLSGLSSFAVDSPPHDAPLTNEVLALEGARVREITAFVLPELSPQFGLPVELN
jgi:hypothetical protein